MRDQPCLVGLMRDQPCLAGLNFLLLRSLKSGNYIVQKANTVECGNGEAVS